jgi:hypothetical protein
MSQRIVQIHHDLIIADQWTEPHSPWQNPAELHGVKYLKSHAQTHKQTVSSSRKGNHDSTIATMSLLVTVTMEIMMEKTTSHKIWFSQQHWMQKDLKMAFGFVIVVQVHTIVLWIEACLMFRILMRTFELEMGFLISN